MLRNIFFVVLLIFSAGLMAKDQTFSSSKEPTALVELYTSEGCSSCPPADRWLSSLKSDEGLWTKFVPLAFHVDYWDYIGWPDRFADNKYSQRQRRYAHEFSEPTVYTPGVRWAGYEWRSWRRGGLPNQTPQKSAEVLSFTLSENGRFTANYPADQGAARLNVAVLGSDLKTQVKRGENRGETLEHDFVVLNHKVFNVAENGQWQGTVDKPSVLAPQYSLAVWVSKDDSQTPLQATGGYLEKSFWAE